VQELQPRRGGGFGLDLPRLTVPSVATPLRRIGKMRDRELVGDPASRRRQSVDRSVGSGSAARTGVDAGDRDGPTTSDDA